MTAEEEREEIQVGKVCPPEIGYKKPPPQEKAFAADTAAITGESKRSINQHLARAEALGDDLDKVAGTWMRWPSDSSQGYERGYRRKQHHKRDASTCAKPIARVGLPPRLMPYLSKLPTDCLQATEKKNHATV